MIVSIHQPAYLPWLGYFDKIKRADLFIYLDTVQFQKNSFQNRNKILTKSGPIWLTVPVKTSGVLYETQLKDIAVDGAQNWQAKHLAALRMNYARAPRFAEILAVFEPFYHRRWERLSDLCWEMLAEFNRLLGVGTPMIRASEMAVPVESAKSALVLDLCRAVGATTYVSGTLGRDYLDLADFAAAGIAVEFQDYRHPVYPQVYKPFEPYMSAIDLLFNVADPQTVLSP